MQRSGWLEGEIHNLEDKLSLSPFHRAKNMDQKCVIVEFYGVFILNKPVIQLHIIRFMFYLSGHIKLTKLKLGNKSEPYTAICTYENGTKMAILVYFCVR